MLMTSLPVLLVLCHGNRYRSPYAAYRLQELLAGQYAVLSAGFKAEPVGGPAAKRMRLAAAQRGVELGLHRRTAVTRRMVEDARLVVYMDGGNAARLHDLMGRSSLAWVNLAEATQTGTRIADPAFLGEWTTPAFQAVLDHLDLATTKLAAQLR